MGLKLPKVIIEKRQAYEINTDSQKRCYNGCHFSSEIVWSHWTIFERTTEKDAVKRLEFWRELNQIAVDSRGKSAAAEYRLKPRGTNQ
jgi:hypothetical protein